MTDKVEQGDKFDNEDSSGGSSRPDTSQKVPGFSVYAEWRANLEADFENIVVGGLFALIKQGS